MHHANGANARSSEEPQQALRKMAGENHEERLFVALRKISELENRQSKVSLREQKLLKQVEFLLAEIRLQNTTPGPHDQFTAVRIDKAVTLLTLVMRRDYWLSVLSRYRIEGPMFGLYPHDGGNDPINILIVATGGIGDTLYASTLIHALYERFPRPRIVIILENPAALCAVENNPLLLQAVSLQGEELQRFVGDVVNLDIFDLIVDVRYAVSYATPPLSRVPFQFVLAAHTRASEWQKYVRYDWPHLNNQFAKAVVERGMSKLDLVGYTANLPITKTTALSFFIENEVPRDVGVALAGRAFVTVHHGADKNMSGSSGLQTKNLPTHTWRALTARLKSAKLLVVQVGAALEELIEGVDVDLRGRLTLEQTGLVLKNAEVHFDTEGGLVHLMRALQGTSVVAFGPTSVGFFGYPENINLSPKVCGDCWWITRTWSVECPRDLLEPECMSAFTPEDIWAALLKVKRMRLKISPKKVALPLDDDEATVVGAWIASVVNKVGENGLVSVAKRADLETAVTIFGQKGIAGTVLLRSSLFQDAAQMNPAVRILPWSRFHIPASDESFDYALIVASDDNPEVTFDHAIEICRLVRERGEIALAVPTASLPGLLKAFSQRATLLLGSRINCDFSEIGSRVTSIEYAGTSYSIFGLAVIRSIAEGLASRANSLGIGRTAGQAGQLKPASAGPLLAHGWIRNLTHVVPR